LNIARVRTLAFALALALTVAIAPVAMASSSPPPDSISVTDLARNGSDYDNQIVELTGEVVGDTIREGQDQGWLTLTDGESSISLLVSSDDATKIENHGRYKITGTEVRVVGRFHLACSEHAGLSDIHATSLEVIDYGGQMAIAVNYGLLGLGATLVVGGALLAWLYRFLRNRSR
jgi:hypothetical protein